MLIFQRCHRNLIAYKEDMLAGLFYKILSRAFTYFFILSSNLLECKSVLFECQAGVADLAGRVCNELGAMEVGHSTNNQCCLRNSEV